MSIAQRTFSDRWAALASPARAEILTLLEALGEATVGDLALAMGRRADRLYHHVHVLEGAGLVLAAGSRPAPRRDETLYALVDGAGEMRPGADEAEGMVRMARAMCRTGLERLGENVRREMFDGRTVQFRAEDAWLTEAELEEIGDHLIAARRVFERARARGGSGGSGGSGRVADGGETNEPGERGSLIMMLTRDGRETPGDGDPG